MTCVKVVGSNVLCLGRCVMSLPSATTSCLHYVDLDKTMSRKLFDQSGRYEGKRGDTELRDQSREDLPIYLTLRKSKLA